jgi:hypothetical protein
VFEVLELQAEKIKQKITKTIDNTPLIPDRCFIKRFLQIKKLQV